MEHSKIETDTDEYELYEYTPLPTPRSIRLVQIDPPSEGSAQIRLKIHVTDLADEDNRDRYIALSYTWGDPFPDSSPEDQDLYANASFSIECDGKHLLVGWNLLIALVQLQEQQKELNPLTPAGQQVYYWIDAISICQDDKDEKAAQVQQMGNIYASADLVIAWLGDGDETAQRALPLIYRFSAGIDSANLLGGPIYQYHNFNSPTFYETLDTFDESLDEAQWADVMHFFNRNYFKRVWLMQEVLLAPVVLAYCGAWRMEFRAFMQFLEMLMRLQWTKTLFEMQPAWRLTFEQASCIVLCQGKLDCGLDFDMRYERRLREFGLCISIAELRHTYYLHQLVMFRGRLATDARDHIHCPFAAARRQPTPELALLPLPDYKQDVVDLYIQIAGHFLKYLPHPVILSLCGDTGLRQMERLPSWVPDWTSEVRGVFCGEFYRHRSSDEYTKHPMPANLLKHLAPRETFGFQACGPWMYDDNDIESRPQPRGRFLDVQAVYLDDVFACSDQLATHLHSDSGDITRLLDFLFSIEPWFYTDCSPLEAFMMTLLLGKIHSVDPGLLKELTVIADGHMRKLFAELDKPGRTLPEFKGPAYSLAIEAISMDRHYREVKLQFPFWVANRLLPVVCRRFVAAPQDSSAEATLPEPWFHDTSILENWVDFETDDLRGGAVRVAQTGPSQKADESAATSVADPASPSVSSATTPGKWHESIRTFSKLVQAVISRAATGTPDFNVHNLGNIFKDLLEYRSGSCRLCQTRRNFFGAAPGTTRPGDHIWVVRGARAPLVLRPLENERFQLVGDAYVYGFMKGEVFEKGMGERVLEDAISITLE